MAVKIYPTSKGLAMATLLYPPPEYTLLFEGYGLYDAIRELFVKLSMGELSYFWATKLESDVSEML